MNIEKYLVLDKYLLSLFGVSDFRDLKEKLKDAPVGPVNYWAFIPNPLPPASLDKFSAEFVGILSETDRGIGALTKAPPSRSSSCQSFDNYLQKCYNIDVLSGVVYKRIIEKTNSERLGGEARDLLRKRKMWLSRLSGKPILSK